MNDDERLDHTPVGKGKYATLTPDQIAQKYPDYMIWAFEKWMPKPCSELLYKECVKDMADYWQQHGVTRDQDYE